MGLYSPGPGRQPVKMCILMSTNTEHLPGAKPHGDTRDQGMSKTSCPQGAPSLVKETGI